MEKKKPKKKQKYPAVGKLPGAGPGLCGCCRKEALQELYRSHEEGSQTSSRGVETEPEKGNQGT